MGPPPAPDWKRPRRTSMPPIQWQPWLDRRAFNMSPKPSGRFTLREIMVKKWIDGPPGQPNPLLAGAGWRLRGQHNREGSPGRPRRAGQELCARVRGAEARLLGRPQDDGGPARGTVRRRHLADTVHAMGKPGYLTRTKGSRIFCVNDHWKFPLAASMGRQPRLPRQRIPRGGHSPGRQILNPGPSLS